jgi:hypothetical protein
MKNGPPAKEAFLLFSSQLKYLKIGMIFIPVVLSPVKNPEQEFNLWILHCVQNDRLAALLLRTKRSIPNI